jgi:hypothetical protein
VGGHSIIYFVNIIFLDPHPTLTTTQKGKIYENMVDMKPILGVET